MYVIWFSRMAEMGFTRGRIDQAHQGSVSIRILPVYRNIVLTTNLMFFFLKINKLWCRDQYFWYSQCSLILFFFYFFFIQFLDMISFPCHPWDAMIRYILMDIPKLFLERLSNSLTCHATRSWSWLRYVYLLFTCTVCNFDLLIVIGVFYSRKGICSSS